MDIYALDDCLDQMTYYMYWGRFRTARNIAEYTLKNVVKQVNSRGGKCGMDREVCQYAVGNLRRFLWAFRLSRYEDMCAPVMNTRSVVKIHLASVEIPGVVA